MAQEFSKPMLGPVRAEESLIRRRGRRLGWDQDLRQIGQIPRREWFARGQRGG